MSADKQKRAVAALSVISNLLLVIFKLLTGFISGSVSIMSEAIHSGVDLIASLIAVFAVSKSGEPADEDHEFGHGKFENISALAEALLIFVAATWIIFKAANKLLHPSELESAGLGVAVMFVSSLVNLVVSKMLFKVGKKTDSIALIADAWHLRTDVYTSAGVMGGLFIYWLGGIAAPRLYLLWIDPVAALLVALLIFKAAWRLSTESLRDLLDESLPRNEHESIREKLSGLRPRLISFKNLRTRKSGSIRFINVDAIVDATMTVAQSHELTDIIEENINGLFPNAVVTVHVEPCASKCTADCKTHCVQPDASHPPLVYP